MKFDRRTVLKFMAGAAAVGLVGLPQIPLWENVLTKYQLGKKPARDAAKLKFRDYFDWSKFPAIPDDFGHEGLVADWQVLGNDVVGDCAIAGPMHAEMLWNAQAKRPVAVNTKATLAAYSAITGYDPAKTDTITGENPTDMGSDVAEVAEYWRSTGLTDAAGNVHKIDAYLALEPGNVDELFAALYLFDGVGIGINFPGQWMDAFNKGQIWDVVGEDAGFVGGHYVLGVGKRGGNINVITWGKPQLMTPDGYRQVNDETFIYLSEEKMTNGKTLEGFDLDQLKSDLKAFADQPLACPVRDEVKKRPRRKPEDKAEDKAEAKAEEKPEGE